MTRLVPLVLLVLVTAGCASGPPDGPDGEWALVSGTVDGRPLDVRAQWPVSLVVDGGSLAGDAPCNSYFAHARRFGGRFAVRPDSVGGSAVGCPGDLGEFERGYTTAIARVREADAGATSLVLRGDGVTLTFRRTSDEEPELGRLSP